MTRRPGRASSAKTLVPGRASGSALVLAEPVSFWGGVDPSEGRIIDRHHPQAGESVTGVVLVMPSGRGSSSSSSVLAETIRAGTGPAAILLAEPDRILALGALVAGELYDRWIPVVVLERTDYEAIVSGETVEIEADAGGASVTL